jgi:Tol biopolymer transport system component
MGNVIGAPDNDGNGESSGHVRIYDIDSSGSSWTQVGQDIDGQAANDRSGSSVAMSADGSRIVIGAPGIDGNGSSSGHVRIYDIDSSGTSRTQVGQDIDGEAAVAMSTDGLRIAISVTGNDDNGFDSGHVRIYDIDSSGTSWSQVGQDIDGEAAVAMSTDGLRIAISATGNDDNGFDSGHVRIYDIDSSGTSWSQVGQDIDGEAAEDTGFSVAMSADGSRIAIGAPTNDGSGSNSGHVRIYGLV